MLNEIILNDLFIVWGWETAVVLKEIVVIQ